MSTSNEEYLRSIEIGDLYLSRANDVISFYENICPGEFKDIFVCDYYDKDGRRNYTSLWFFGEKYCAEAKNFLTDDNFDLTTIKEHVKWFELQKTEYDMQKSTARSRLSVKATLISSISCDLKAAGVNCDKLNYIFRKYFLSNICSGSHCC